MRNFLDRKNTILSVFQKAKDDLEVLNNDIKAKVEDNAAIIEEKVKENIELNGLIKSNEVVRNKFSKFFL